MGSPRTSQANAENGSSARYAIADAVEEGYVCRERRAALLGDAAPL